MVVAERIFGARPGQGTRKAAIKRGIGDCRGKGDICPALRSGNHGRHQSSTRNSLILLGMLALAFASVLVAERRHDPVVIDGLSLDIDAVGMVCYDLDIHGDGIDAGLGDVFRVGCLPLIVPPEQVNSLQNGRQKVRLGPIPVNPAIKASHLRVRVLDDTGTPITHAYTIENFFPSSSLPFYAWMLITTLLLGLTLSKWFRITTTPVTTDFAKYLIHMNYTGGLEHIEGGSHEVTGDGNPHPTPASTRQNYENADFSSESTSAGAFQRSLHNERELTIHDSNSIPIILIDNRYPSRDPRFSPGPRLICLNSSNPSSNMLVISGLDADQGASFKVIPAACASPSRSYSSFKDFLHILRLDAAIGGGA